MSEVERYTSEDPARRASVIARPADRRPGALAAAVLLGACAALASERGAGEELIGGEGYLARCAACHGAGGRGDGPSPSTRASRPAT